MAHSIDTGKVLFVCKKNEVCYLNVHNSDAANSVSGLIGEHVLRFLYHAERVGDSWFQRSIRKVHNYRRAYCGGGLTHRNICEFNASILVSGYILVERDTQPLGSLLLRLNTIFSINAIVQ
jgi:hypothetical protein